MIAYTKSAMDAFRMKPPYSSQNGDKSDPPPASPNRKGARARTGLLFSSMGEEGTPNTITFHSFRSSGAAAVCEAVCMMKLLTSVLLCCVSLSAADDRVKVDNDAVRILKVVDTPHQKRALHRHDFNCVMIYLDA